MKNNFKKNVVWNTLGMTFNSFNSLFFLILVNRINGINTAGIFSFAFSVACLLYVVGIYSGRTFQVSDIKGELNDKEYLVHKILTCLIMIIIVMFFILIKDYTLDKNLIIVIMTVYKLLEAFSETFYGYLQKNEELHIVGKSLFYKSIVGLMVFFFVDYFTKNIVLSCVALVINSIVYIIFYDIRKSISLISKDKVRINKVLKLFKIGFSVFVFSFLAIFIVNVPKYVIDVLLSDSYQTIFSIIIMPGTVMSLCGQYIMAPLLTQVVDFYNQQLYDEFINLIIKMIKILILLGFLVEVVAAFIGIPVLSFIYSINLDKYKIDLILVIFGAILYALSGVLSTALVTMRKNTIQMLIYIIDSIFSIFACYILIKSFGVHGAVYGYVLTMVLHSMLYIFYFMFEFKKCKKNINL